MSDDTRQQKRKLQREMVKLGKSVVAAGVKPVPHRAEIAAAAHVLRAKLTERSNGHRASEAAALAHDMMETALKTWPGKVEIACRKGCSYCCHTFVMTIAPEIFRVAEMIRAGRVKGIDVAIVESRAAPLKGLGPDQRTGSKLPCPLLQDGMCSVYAERPIVCRQATSLSLPSCIDEYEGIDKTGQVKVSSAHLAHAGNANVALLGAMRAVGLDTKAYEFSSALVVALSAPDTEQRWLEGEDVFREISAPVARLPEIDHVAAEIAADLNR